jgi:hypothetical protein
MSMLYSEDATKAAMKVKARLSEKNKITNLNPASKSTARKMVPALASVLARKPSSPRFSNVTICRMLTVHQLQWILM